MYSINPDLTSETIRKLNTPALVLSGPYHSSLIFLPLPRRGGLGNYCPLVDAVKVCRGDLFPGGGVRCQEKVGGARTSWSLAEGSHEQAHPVEVTSDQKRAIRCGTLEVMNSWEVTPRINDPVLMRGQELLARVYGQR